MRRQEEAMRIMEALSGVDEELLARCEAAGTADTGEETEDSLKDVRRLTGRKRERQGSRSWRYLSRCAAVLALAAVGAASWSGLRVLQDNMVNNSASGGSPQATAMDDFTLNLESEEGLAAEDRGAAENMGITGSMISESKLAEKDFQGEADGAPAVPAEASPGVNGAGGASRTDGVGTTDGLDGTDYTDMPETMNKEDCLLSAARMLTADEARQTDLLGSYVPTSLPAGYAFESARYDEASGRLTIWWDKGVDNIMLSFEQVDSGSVETVDIQKPETYDERLYEIPFGDAVPEEYRQVFFAPVFAKDDFGLEIVRSRVLSYNGDSGDTSTPRGSFSVLYDGVLVCFNGRGTPEEIWEMFASIAEQ